MAKKNLSKQKKMDTRVNFTPMVDMMMLLITFFMLCTTLAKPQAMQLTMPSNEDTKQLNEEQKQVTKASHTITLYLGSDDKVWYIAGPMVRTVSRRFSTSTPLRKVSTPWPRLNWQRKSWMPRRMRTIQR